ncbi:hypothetical protein EON65_26795 [archaeon]|nr:MAG: hypothetical protein EON65_26795 [archaeon]
MIKVIGFCLLVLVSLIPSIVQCETVPQDQVNALYDLYNSTRGQTWHWYPNIPGVSWNFTNYNPNSSVSTTDPCEDDWEGVFCNCTVTSPVNCDIVQLNLTFHNLTGSLPSTLNQLTYLTVLDLSFNHITNTLPANLGDISSLQLLNLCTNSIMGSIPSNWSTLYDLVIFDVGFNNLNNSIPAGLFDRMDKLEAIVVNDNFLTGKLPDNLSRLTSLALFNVHDNQFEGPLPSLSSSQYTLQSLDVSFNFLEGPFPTSLFNMTVLTSVDISRNFFEGSLPDNFTSSQVIDTLRISYNFFFGPLPSSLSSVSSLAVFELDQNLFNGSLPEWLGLLSGMRYFSASNNTFTSTLPSALSEWQQIDTFRVMSNLFHGRVNETFVNMSLMISLDLSKNMFSGSLPGSSQAWVLLQEFTVFYNKFSGTLSTAIAIFSHNSLVSINANDNSLEGTVSELFSDMPTLSFFSLANNHFSGPLPDFFATPKMSLIILANNQFTGTISPFIGQLQDISWFNVSHNRLTGTIPDSFGSVELPQLTEVDLSVNQLTGTLPPTMSTLSALQILYLTHNKFSGDLQTFVNSSIQKDLLNIDVSHNDFTGVIPTEPFLLNNLKIFAAATNCLSGTLPEAICSAPDLRTLVLDGVSTAEKCRQYISPFSSSFVLTKALKGTIPPCIFTMRMLVSLRLSSNYLTGSLPTNYSLSLLNLSVSHNFIHGTIPYELQRKLMSNLDLSYNRLTGYLIKDFAHIPREGSLYTQVNRLSGTIPGPIKSAEKITILDGNIFSCNYIKEELPAHDPGRDTYVCASHKLDISLIAWATLFSIVVFGFIGCLLANYCIEGGKYDHSLDIVMSYFKYLWNLNGYIYPTITSSSATNISIRSMHRVFTHSRLLALALTAYIVLFLLPMYTILTNNLYTNSYGWTISAVLVAGPVATTFLSIAFSISMLLLLIYVWRLNTESSGDDEGSAKSSLFVVKYAHQAMFVVLLFTINCLVMLGADIIYVLIALNSQRYNVVIGEIGMAIFKLMWNESMLWRLIPLLRLFLEKQDDAKELGGNDIGQDAKASSESSPTTTPSLTPRSDVECPRATTVAVANRPRKLSAFSIIDLQNVSYESSDVPLIAGLSQFNNIVVPALAIACVSSDCFLTAIFPTSNVLDSYFASSCLILAVEKETGQAICLDRVYAPRYVSYDPPFAYSYMCASSIVMNYTPVYVFLFMFCGILIPAAKLFIRSAMHSTGDNFLKRLIGKHVSALYLPAVPATELLSTQPKKLFSKEKVTVRLTSSLGLLVAFGTIYPPLALIACFAMFSFTFTEHILQSLLIRQADSMGLSWYRERLGEDARGIGRLFISTLYFIIPYAALAFGYLLFDTLGYTNGWEDGLLVAILVTVCWPIAVRLARLFYLIVSQDDSVPESTNFSLVSSVMFVLGGSSTIGRNSTIGRSTIGDNSFIVQNPLRDGSMTEDSNITGANTIPNLRLSALDRHNKDASRLGGQSEDSNRGSTMSSLSFFSRKSAGLRAGRFQHNDNDEL